MRYILLMIGVLLPASASAVQAGDGQAVRRQWLGHDLHLAGEELTSYETDSGRHVLVFERGFAMTLAGREFTGSGTSPDILDASALAWLDIANRALRASLPIPTPAAKRAAITA